jgi:outer membrane receptor for ferrienterochelin and colicins
MRRSSILSSGLALLLFGVGTSARADDGAPDLEGTLDTPVVVAASKTAETGTAAPATSMIMTAEDLRRWGIHTLDEAIDFLSLGVVTANPLLTPDVGARGVLLPNDSGDHFLLLVDGHAVNEPLFGAARFGRGAGVPLELIDHIEVILGPGSVLYGSNAMLGVIHVVTKRAKDLPGSHVVVESEIGKSYRVGAFAGYALGQKSELTVGLEYYKQLGPTFTFGPQDLGIDKASGAGTITRRHGPADGIWGGQAANAYYSEVPSAYLRFVSGGFEASVRAWTFKRGSPYRARYSLSVLDFDDPDSYEVDRGASLDLAYHATLSPVVQLKVRGYGDTYDYQRYLNSSEVSGCFPLIVPTCQYHGGGVSRWGGLEVQSSFDWLRDARLVTLLGVDARIRYVGFKLDTSDYDTGEILAPSQSAFKKTERTLGAYLQQTWHALPWLNLNGGARLDLDERFARVLSPRFAASAQTWKGGTLKAIYAEAFRSPSYFETDLRGLVQVQGRNLLPERVRSIEGSIEQKFGAHRLLFGVFRSWWRDLVELHQLTAAEEAAAVARGELEPLRSGVTQFRNVSSVENYGMNASFDGSSLAGTLRYGLTVTLAYAHRVDTVGSTPLTVAPQAFGNMRIAYQLPGEWPVLGLAAHWMGQRVADRAYDGGFVPTPTAPVLVELRATVSGPVPKLRGLSYRASANWASAARGPYVVGPTQDIRSGPVAELVPIDRFRVTVGLQYDLPF